MKYYANFWANNGTSWMRPEEHTNKKTLIKHVRKIAEGERFAGNGCSWMVWDENERIVAAGGTDRMGRRFRDYEIVGEWVF